MASESGVSGAPHIPVHKITTSISSQRCIFLLITWGVKLLFFRTWIRFASLSNFFIEKSSNRTPRAHGSISRMVGTFPLSIGNGFICYQTACFSIKDERVVFSVREIATC